MPVLQCVDNYLVLNISVKQLMKMGQRVRLKTSKGEDQDCMQSGGRRGCMQHGVNLALVLGI